jgi:hypothetical protein
MFGPVGAGPRSTKIYASDWYAVLRRMNARSLACASGWYTLPHRMSDGSLSPHTDALADAIDWRLVPEPVLGPFHVKGELLAFSLGPGDGDEV